MTEEYNRPQQEIEGEIYLQKNDIFGLFKELTESLVVNKPKDPIGHLIQKLTQDQSKKYCNKSSQTYFDDWYTRL